VEFDPKLVSYEKILDAFFEMHDPTTVNRQGPDVGTQYRSVIFYAGPAQKKAAEKAVLELGKSGKLPKPVVTKIEKAGKFYPAEEYHQKYYEKNGLASCRI
ncbi:MAG TPA: peptide-methionine (S)-S-oxide reductase MsrA, partial [Candidatus Micrarchaeota archaeon]|nr:peptide-methionine (S)-S-oxide reductase MsrA [Candidatus Micrarchaeota archaeon]